MNLKSKLSYKTFKIKLLKILKTNVSKREKWKKTKPYSLMLTIYHAIFINLYKHKTKLKLKIEIKETKLSSK